MNDQQRAGRPVEIDGNQRAKVTALSCSESSEGYERWNLRLLTNKVVELGYREHISHTEVADILKKNDLKPISNAPGALANWIAAFWHTWNRY